MTDATLAAVDDAIRAHLAAQPETATTMVAHWTLVAGLIDDDTTPVWLEAPKGQPDYVTTGLLQTGCALATAGIEFTEED